MGRDGVNRSEDVAHEEDTRKTVQLIRRLRDKHSAEWAERGIGFAYDGRSSLYTTHSLRLNATNTDGQPFLDEIVGLPDSNG